MTLFLDQFLYPLGFLITIYILLLALKTISSQPKKSLLLAFFAGWMAYLAIFISFSILPLLPLSLGLVVLHFLLIKKREKIMESLKIGFSYLFGLFIPYFAVKFWLNYDPFPRYQNAFRFHRESKGFVFGMDQILKAIKVNNLDFSSWIGFGIALLVVIYILRSIYSLTKGENISYLTRPRVEQEIKSSISSTAGICSISSFIRSTA